MAEDVSPNKSALPSDRDPEAAPKTADPRTVNASRWRRLLRTTRQRPQEVVSSGASSDELDEMKAKPEKWSLGVLNDKETEEVPGT